MSSSLIEFSAQFGGRDAASAVMHHFRALKAAASGLPLVGFPFPKLAFVLRVDGDVNQYCLSGVGELEIDHDGEYVSVDIGLQRNDRGRLIDAISTAILALASVDRIKYRGVREAWSIDYESLRKCLSDLVFRYKKAVSTV